METVADFIFSDSKITVDGDSSREIKRCLLLGRKAMTNPDSVLKSRDITLPSKVCLVKILVFPFVMYRSMWELDHKEGWVLKNWYFWTVVLEKTLDNSLDSKEIKPGSPKGNQPYIFIGRTDSESDVEYFGHLIQKANSPEKTLMLGKIEGRRRSGWQRMRCLDGITNTMDMSSHVQRTW